MGVNRIFMPVPTVEPTPTPSPTLTPDPTESWQDYKDEKVGIEFKYPDSWYASAYTPLTFSVFLENKPIKIPEASEFLTSIQVGFNEATNTTTNEKFYQEKTLAEGVKRYKELFDIKTVKIVENLFVGGKKAIQISGSLGPGMLEGSYFKYTLVQMDDHLLIVSLYKDENQEIYNQILSTFKFTELVGTPSPKDQ